MNNGAEREPGGIGTMLAQGIDNGIPSTQEWAEATHEVLEEMAREETTHDQTDHRHREMMQQDVPRQGNNFITQARTTTTYSPAMEGTCYPAGQEEVEEEATNLH
jgi:hypothetical protein